jgi:large subunit ribosomal protein L25
MKKVNLDVEKREQTGTADIKRLRKSGFVPGIVYGGEGKSLPIKLDRKKLIHFLHSIGEENVLTNLRIKKNGDSSEQLVVLKDVQYDPVTEQLVHLDFQRVSMKKKMISELHVLLKGEPEGVKVGGILDQALRTVEVEGLPQDMPEHLEIDISGLKIHDSVHVKDLPLPSGVEMITDGERSVLSVLPPRKIEEEEIPEEITEPELVGEEGEEEAAEAAGEEGKKPAEPQAEKKEEHKAEPQAEKKEGHKEEHKKEAEAREQEKEKKKEK